MTGAKPAGPAQAFDERREMGRPGVGNGDLPVVLDVVRWNPFHLGQDGDSLVAAAELAEGCEHRAQDRLDPLAAHRTLDILQRLIVVAQVILCHRAG
jgi:hypothetical protein